jgi:hypothetical protein
MYLEFEAYSFFKEKTLASNQVSRFKFFFGKKKLSRLKFFLKKKTLAETRIEFEVQVFLKKKT